MTRTHYSAEDPLTIHLGIVGDANALDGSTLTDEGQPYLDGHQYGNPRDLGPFLTDGDSFLSWGDPSLRSGDADLTLHVQATTDLRAYDPTGLSLAEANARYDEGERLLALIADLRADLSQHLNPGERLADYVVVTDREDWSEGQHTFVLESFR
jgi:hypothetical protein